MYLEVVMEINFFYENKLYQEYSLLTSKTDLYHKDVFQLATYDIALALFDV